MRKEDLKINVFHYKFNFSMVAIPGPLRWLADCYWVSNWRDPDSTVAMKILNGKN